ILQYFDKILQVEQRHLLIITEFENHSHHSFLRIVQPKDLRQKDWSELTNGSTQMNTFFITEGKQLRGKRGRFILNSYLFATFSNLVVSGSRGSNSAQVALNIH